MATRARRQERNRVLGLQTLESRVVLDAAPYLISFSATGTHTGHGVQFETPTTPFDSFSISNPVAYGASLPIAVVPGVPYAASATPSESYEKQTVPCGGGVYASTQAFLGHEDLVAPIGQPETAGVFINNYNSATHCYLPTPTDAIPQGSADDSLVIKTLSLFKIWDADRPVAGHPVKGKWFLSSGAGAIAEDSRPANSGTAELTASVSIRYFRAVDDVTPLEPAGTLQIVVPVGDEEYLYKSLEDNFALTTGSLIEVEFSTNSEVTSYGDGGARLQFRISEVTASNDNGTAINDAPVRTAGTLTPISVNEDFANITAATLGVSALSYAPGPPTAIDEINQTLTYTVSAIPAFIRLFKADGVTAVNAGATVTATELKGLKYKTVANANGTGNIVLTIRDNGSGTAPHVNTLVENLAITVTAINDAPVRTAGTLTPIIVNEDSANITAITLGLTALSYAPGPATATNEISQTLTYTISVIPAFIRLFKGDGVTAVNAGATVTATELKGLKYKTVANANGTGKIVLTIRDNGSGTAPHVNTLVENLAITVTAINDAPVRTAGTLTPIIVNEDSANITAITLGLTALSYAPGPATATNEISQTLTYTISVIPAFIRLFKGDGITAVNAGATVTATELKGLKYEIVANANGTGKIVLTIRDNGSGTAPHVNTLIENLAVTVKAV